MKLSEGEVVFGFGKKTTGQPEDPAAQREAITELAQQIFHEQGIETQRQEGRWGPELLATNHPNFGVFVLGNSFDELTALPDRSEWRPRLEQRITALIKAYERPSQMPMSDEAWREAIRVRLVQAGSLPEEMEPVQQPFIAGLQIALYIDQPETVSPVLRPHLEHTSLSVDELFSQGMQNTHGEPIERKMRVGEQSYAVFGDSFFIASKIVDLEPMIGPVFPEGPAGALVAIPNRNIIGYSPIGPETATASLSEMAQFQANEMVEAREILSDFLFYSQPDGSIGIAAKIIMEGDGVRISVAADSPFEKLLIS